MNRALVCASWLASMISPAAADFYVHLPNGRYFVFPNGFLLICVIVAGAGIGFMLVSAAEARKSKNGLPEEINSPDSAEAYDDQAARLRALKRKLDAETDLNESKIAAARTKAELDELSDILRHDKSKRSLRR